MIFSQILENDILRLEKIESDDFDILYGIAKDPEIWKQHPQSDRYREDVFRNFFDVAKNSSSAYKIWHKEDEKYIGSSRFYDENILESSIAIGYTYLATAYWGGAVNASLKKLMIDNAFEYVDKVYFHIGENNIRSQKAVAKIGARYQGQVPFDYYGNIVMQNLYKIDKQDWSILKK